MATFSEALGSELRSAFCTVLGGVRAAQNLARPLTDPFPAAGPFPYLYNSLCNQPPPPTEPQPPFLGGQCLISYTVSIAWTATAIPGSGLSDESGTDNIVATGPIQGVSIVDTAGRLFAELRATSIPTAGGASSFRYRSVSKSFYSAATASIISVTPNSAVPDNCGNPPPLPIPPLQPGDNEYPGNIDYTTEEGDNINIPITVILGYANISPTGNFSFPMSINFSGNPELNIDGDYNPADPDNPFSPSPTGSGGGGGNSGNGNPQPDPDLPDDPLGQPDPGIPDPVTPENPELEEVLVGVIVRVTTIPPSVSRVFQGDNPDILVPDVGVVNFRYRIGKAGVWSEDFRVKNANQFIPVPSGYVAIGASGTPRPGAEFSITPVRQPRQTNIAYPTF